MKKALCILLQLLIGIAKKYSLGVIKYYGYFFNNRYFKEESHSNLYDGVVRVTDNICIARFWRCIKYEEIYLNEYKNMKIFIRAIKNVWTDTIEKDYTRQLTIKLLMKYYQYFNNLDFKGEKLLQMLSWRGGIKKSCLLV